jgi:3-isopropylmalate dehydratase small subunit
MTTFCYVTGDNLSTDLIHPPDFFSLDQTRRKQGLLYGYNQEWAKTIEPGSIIIGGENFGCGSSREVTAQVFADRKIKLVCAKSFARIFYRNMINLGIPLYTISTAIPWQANTRVEVIHSDTNRQISDLSGNSISLDKPSSFTKKIIANGGLLHSINDLFQPQHYV